MTLLYHALMNDKTLQDLCSYLEHKINNSLAIMQLSIDKIKLKHPHLADEKELKLISRELSQISEAIRAIRAAEPQEIEVLLKDHL
jgi:GDP-D-mannose dehydratase